MPFKTAAGAAIAACVALVVPSTALATDHRSSRFDRDAFRGDDVPSRVAAPLARAGRALARAEERIDDGEADRAAASLTSARRALASALKAAKRRLPGDDGEVAAEVVADAQHEVVLGVANLYDGQDGTVVEALDATLTAAVDGRDGLVAAVDALGEDAGDFEDVFGTVADGAADELEALQEVREDDELTEAADASLAAALTKITATRAAAEARLDADDEADYGDEEDEEDEDDVFEHRHHHGEHRRRPCPKRGEHDDDAPAPAPGTDAGQYPSDATAGV